MATYIYSLHTLGGPARYVGKKKNSLGYRHTEQWKKDASLRMTGNQLNAGRPSPSAETRKLLSLAAQKRWSVVRQEA